MIIKILCGISALLVTLLLLGCAAPNTQSDPVKPGSDGSEATSVGDMPEYSGIVTFYSESVDEAGKEPRCKDIRKLESEEAGQIADMLTAVEWVYEGVVDVAAISYDGEIVLNDMDKAIILTDTEEPTEKNDCKCYFGYQGNLYLRFIPGDADYHIGYYGGLTDEQMQIIENMKP